jgi:hypothetical protein
VHEGHLGYSDRFDGAANSTPMVTATTTAPTAHCKLGPRVPDAQLQAAHIPYTDVGGQPTA